MNTTSLVLNGRTASDLATLPARKMTTLTALPSRSHRPQRPPHRRQTSKDSPGWYNTDDGMTLEDFAARLETLTKRFERFQGMCAQNVVMALMRPTPIMLFVFNPVFLMLGCLIAGMVWVVGLGR